MLTTGALAQKAEHSQPRSTHRAPLCRPVLSLRCAFSARFFFDARRLFGEEKRGTGLAERQPRNTPRARAGGGGARSRVRPGSARVRHVSLQRDPPEGRERPGKSLVTPIRSAAGSSWFQPAARLRRLSDSQRRLLCHWSSSGGNCGLCWTDTLLSRSFLSSISLSPRYTGASPRQRCTRSSSLAPR